MPLAIGSKVALPRFFHRRCSLEPAKRSSRPSPSRSAKSAQLAPPSSARLLASVMSSKRPSPKFISKRAWPSAPTTKTSSRPSPSTSPKTSPAGVAVSPVQAAGAAAAASGDEDGFETEPVVAYPLPAKRMAALERPRTRWVECCFMVPEAVGQDVDRPPHGGGREGPRRASPRRGTRSGLRSVSESREKVCGRPRLRRCSRRPRLPRACLPAAPANPDADRVAAATSNHEERRNQDCVRALDGLEHLQDGGR